MIKGAVQHEDITIINTYVLNIETPKSIKQMLMDRKGEIDNNSHSR